MHGSWWLPVFPKFSLATFISALERDLFKMASVHREAPYITVLLIEHSHSKLNPEPFLKVIPVQVHCALTPASNQVPCSRSLME